MCVSPPPGHTTASDADLVLAAGRRNRDAFVELFGRYAGRINAFVLRAGIGAADAEEVTQDVMVSVWRHAASFDPARAAVSTWIYSIARNRRIDFIRRARRPAPDPQDPLFSPDPAPDGLIEMAAAERQARLLAGLTSLPPEQQRVLEAAFFKGLSHSEIAARDGVPLGTVKSRVRLAFRYLRAALGEDLVEDFDA
jgi:RNA polymerase sigma-70 factor, ECF subfamily